LKKGPESTTRKSTKSPQKRTTKSIKILFLTANPKDTVRLQLDEEVREIEHKIMLAQKKDQFLLIKKGAVQVSDLQLYLNQENPVIVHFSGHGTNEGSIVLEDKMGYPVSVPSVALAKVFETHKDNIRCVVLNACFSLDQAKAINQHIDFVIGMSSSIEDEAAIAFSYAFYLALSSKRSIKNSFDQGISEILLLGYNNEENTPKLLCRNNIDASKVFLF
jgi:CHAT domain-containing protein